MLNLLFTFTNMYGNNSSYADVPVLQYGVYKWFKFLYSIKKANQMHYFSNLFDKALYMFRTDLLSIIRSIWTLYKRIRY